MTKPRGDTTPNMDDSTMAAMSRQRNRLELSQIRPRSSAGHLRLTETAFTSGERSRTTQLWDYLTTKSTNVAYVMKTCSANQSHLFMDGPLHFPC